MTLSEINKRLEKLIVDVPRAGKELSDTQLRIESKKSKLYLSEGCSVAKNQEMRDAYVSERTTKEREAYAYAIGEYKKLINERDLLIVISANERVIAKGSQDGLQSS